MGCPDWVVAVVAGGVVLGWVDLDDAVLGAVVFWVLELGGMDVESMDSLVLEEVFMGLLDVTDGSVPVLAVVASEVLIGFGGTVTS